LGAWCLCQVSSGHRRRSLATRGPEELLQDFLFLAGALALFVRSSLACLLKIFLIRICKIIFLVHLRAFIIVFSSFVLLLEELLFDVVQLALLLLLACRFCRHGVLLAEDAG
jgi:hypothetical protein